MAADSSKAGVTSVEQTPCVIPDLSVKDLLSAIPSHCYKRSALRSLSYVVYDFALLAGMYKTATFLDASISPEQLSLPHPSLYTLARFAVWTLYGFAAGLVMTGLWVIAHECGHQAFSESKFLNNLVGWILHSALGVPYHSWRITHAKHHASTAHMTEDQVFVPKTRSQLGLPPFDPTKEDILGASISNEVKKELWDALGDSPMGASFGAATYLLVGWLMYLIRNASGQKRYPAFTNHFNPNAVMFKPHQRGQIVLSDIGIVLWLGGVISASSYYGFANVLRLYLVPYLWVNHWLVLITFLQHTDPLLPHYRAAEFTFPRGALATLDRQLLGDCGKIMGWLGAHLTHGISETHVLHHVSSKIPHYNAWEATYALRKRLDSAGIKLQGRPGGWAEVYRIYKECKFVEDEGNIVFYKNAHGLAAARPMHSGICESDSGIELDK
ncbi:delta-12 fatty acid desaturase protein [Gloeophyllum trabeum ATCC 11539]|uniref:Delta-12 fatty acid desaturase protein n=1 Tax=Gloeophyllum trabeum (strain ATCC 11539 / FP-39264 / Madison 617) TaxID=670483 RepID=S7RP24_GLOTA|nr:delta-12 fatty acid desaturase protein [Gloeophyllum trabeum ATCC 11539]EPQ54534.1 delta-12 fatty acid desaturase protein [Gloeophyllum trabeum ATCC 11539]